MTGDVLLIGFICFAMIASFAGGYVARAWQEPMGKALAKKILRSWAKSAHKVGEQK